MAVDVKTLIYVIIVIFGAIGTAYAFVFRHIGAKKKHACSDDIVFKDVCDEKTKRLDDCIEAVVKRSDERCAEHKQITETRHLELKQDMKDGFARVEKLIIKNGR